jgi:hypothetical protein
MKTFVINKGRVSGALWERTVKAAKYATVGEFVDFVDGDGVVLRVRAVDVGSIEREQQ